ncbi:MAG: 30S ribosomal protein S20 [Candidatus Nealsonbacteria bacterium RBG_13_42_11]|uniref:Small ribosomal subunit protein bS20 n=1 Tax=Candidatus Nealsonbacteria bacterium RBG_13_42_11 TaxID=1801663 RepID=A0A1G2E167_9BACT|nr:MAG: 30S ribosomal protein S20 [Candidatus Nealsonbacteria bacterium RBG_13_42_11]
MPITKSAKKSQRHSLRRRSMNIQEKQKMKKILKEVASLISGKKKEEAKKILPQVYKALDKAVKSRLLKKNTASRKKSRITKAIFKIQ